MNKSFRGLRNKKFFNFANFIQAMKSVAADLAFVNGHRLNTEVKPRTKFRTLYSRGWMVESPMVMESIAIFDN